MFILKKSYQKLWERLSVANRNKNKYRNALCAVYASYKSKLNTGEKLSQKDQVIYDYLSDLGFNDALKIEKSEEK